MPVRIRLARHGRKGRPFYHIVIADSRAPRDGRFIEKIGTYDPMTNPATVNLNFERSLHWLTVGAQPSDTAKSILSKEGVLLKKHLLGGVKKGALTEEQAEVKFNNWVNDKISKAKASIDKLTSDKDKARKKQLEMEMKLNEEKAQQIAKKKAELAAKTSETVTQDQEQNDNQ